MGTVCRPQVTRTERNHRGQWEALGVIQPLERDHQGLWAGWAYRAFGHWRWLAWCRAWLGVWLHLCGIDVPRSRVVVHRLLAGAWPGGGPGTVRLSFGPLGAFEIVFMGWGADMRWLPATDPDGWALWRGWLTYTRPLAADGRSRALYFSPDATPGSATLWVFGKPGGTGATGRRLAPWLDRVVPR